MEVNVYERGRQSNLNAVLYTASVVIVFLGLTYAAVPLYSLFCSATGFGGTPTRQAEETGMGRFLNRNSKFDPRNMVPVQDGRTIKVTLNSDVGTKLPWTFTPHQKTIRVIPGETALAFYTVTNNSPTEELVGIATYNVVPPKAGKYFNKIQCFCFEEQLLRPSETVDMPVFFFIDPEFEEDPKMADVNNMVLSYSFWNARTLTPKQRQRIVAGLAL